MRVRAMIHTEADYTQAMQRLFTLMDTELKADAAAALELKQLADALADYEQAHIAPIQVSPLEALRFRMEQQGLSPLDLLPVLVTAQHVEAILQGKQDLTLHEMMQLHQRFEIPFAELDKPPSIDSMNEARSSCQTQP